MGRLVPDGLGSGDVVVAPATPPGTSALAAVRLSGPPGETVRVARRFVSGLPDPLRPREARLVEVRDAAGLPLDTAIVLFFAGPASATGEDLLEIFCHGSPAVVRALLEAAMSAGARPARPGEFTRRALEHGKVDLAAAEGIALLCGAAGRGEARRALGLVSGRLSDRVAEIRRRLLDLLGALEAALDFPDDVTDGLDGREAAGILDELRRLLACRVAPAGGAAPSVVIAGRPNAGKSSLFNALVGSDRAIVTEEPGTTRDVIGETVEISGERIRIYDTAGLRPTRTEAERLGVEAAERAADRADLVVHVVDGASPLPPDARTADAGAPGRRLLVESKADLWPPGRTATPGTFAVSVVTGEGLDRLRGRIIEALSLGETEGDVLLVERHQQALLDTERELREAASLGEPELVAAGLRRALSRLGEITGETATEDLLDRIFSTFCVGK